MALLPLLTAASFAVGSTHAAYNVVRDYSGSSFFDGWNYYGSYDNLTNGHTMYLAQDAAGVDKLAYINDAGNAIVKVDDFSEVVWDNKRNSIRLESKDVYDIGSLWVIDAVHLPFGCSVWPAFWTKGATDWPRTGEIDIIEYVNLMSFNQVALHTLPGCVQSPEVTQDTTGTLQTGKTAEADCSIEKGTGGCIVQETKEGSNGAAFGEGGGGVWATQFVKEGVFIWFWPRAQVPASIKESTATSALDIKDFGPPTAAYPVSSCDVEKLFTPQQLVLNIALCGDWADAPGVYNTSGLCTGLCYDNNVMGNGSNYANAYFEIPFIKAYLDESIPLPSSTGGSETTGAQGPGKTNTNPDVGEESGAVRLARSSVVGVVWLAVVAAVVL
ncbi:concanavalin A-like lectin/glucanase domain-containing protein [Pterulicium gracile]|uniref:Concanavalin A-like lectin/glucanase domain-containing protein n=1 Tax=Pterulicium gracile TaxID=1884261 RepID=A0A5C3QFK7_9AGAR|nr:concanavalin A-like lectin/glucanase domain-containing protein [Pterula gracilis]